MSKKLVLDPNKKSLLHIVNGTTPLSAQFKNAAWQEIRLDAQLNNSAKIQGSLRDFSNIPENTFDAIWNSNGVPTLYAHEVIPCFRQCFHALKTDGMLLLILPDLQKLGEIIENSRLNDSLFTGVSGSITPLDLLYGHSASLASGMVDVAHHTGFTAKTLYQALTEAGFMRVYITREGAYLKVVATKLPYKEGAKAEIQIMQEDVNKLMEVRDALDKEPEIAVEFALHSPTE